MKVILNKKDTIKAIYLLVVILVSLIISSCGRYYLRAYSGQALPKDKVAFLITSTIHTDTYIAAIDGKAVHNPSAWWDAAKIEILPGHHTINVYNFYRSYGPYFSTKESGKPITIDIIAKAGCTYLIESKIDGNRWWPVVYERCK